MNLDLLHLLTDFGLLVFIWIVQIIIYPSFRSIELDGFVQWHRSYTRKVSYFAVPLMLAQVMLISFAILLDPNVVLILSGILVSLMWLITFRFAVPLHEKLSTGSNIEISSRQLERVNWWRTTGWSIVFLLTLLDIYVL